MTLKAPTKENHSKLSPAEKRAFLEQRLNRKKKNGEQPQASIPRRTDKTSSPLSYPQEAIWYLEQLNPDIAAYNMSLAWRLRGPLDISALEQSLNALVQRHESLRTSFQVVGEQPAQIITPELTLPLRLVDFRHISSQEREHQAMTYIKEERYRPFDLTQPPLIRASLLQMDQNDHIFVLVMHHIVSDGWSVGILKRDLSVCYSTFRNRHTEPDLPNLPIQYADFASWQREHLKGKILKDHLFYWRSKLADAPPILEPSTDYVRPSPQSYKGRKIETSLPESLHRALQDLSNQEKVTLFITLLTGFKILLHRHTGQDDIVVGTPMINRSRIETEDLIGYFLNNLVLRTTISSNLTFRQLLKSVRETTLEAFTHQEFPFEKLVQELKPERDLSYSPLFQVFFNMYVIKDTKELELSGITVENIIGTGLEVGSLFDITLYIREQNGETRFILVYKSSLFKHERMVEMLAQYKQLLVQISNNPDYPVSEYSLVTPDAKNMLPAPTESLDNTWQGAVHAQFSQQARQQPNQTAIIDNKGVWTYKNLELWSNRLAHYLISMGIQPGDVIAIYSHRSAELVWAWLGILKAGAAFVNLDPAYPAERLIRYMQISKPKGFIYIEASSPLPNQVVRYAERLPWSLTLSKDQIDRLAGYPSSVPATKVGPDDLAIVSFTSGSTGYPKGVLCRQGPLSHFLPWQKETFTLGSSDRFSMLSGLSHDPLQREIFTALWIGATLCIPDPELMGSPGYLAEWMRQEKITFAHLTPALSQLLSETAPSGCQLPMLRHAFFVGEELKQHHITRLRNLAPKVACINMYGTTETQRAVSYYPIPDQIDKHKSKATYSLGRGMPGSQLLVLNNNKQLAGISEVGEIYMRSPHLAAGYIDDKALTTARFITNPFTGTASDRLYRTGDLGCFSSEGNVEFVGRADRQIKIRDFRIEPGEIESALAQHPGIQNTVVIPVNQEQTSEMKYLAAYFVSSQQHPPLKNEDLRNFLKKQLPDHMIPTTFTALESIPLTPNGKIHYAALPLPIQSHFEQSKTFIAPRTPEETQIAAIWTELLGLDKVGIHDNFFDLGGHSLLAVRLCARLNQAVGQNLPLLTLFQAPTIAQQSKFFTQKSSAPKVAHSMVAIRAEGKTPPFFCIPGNLGNVFNDLGALAKYLIPTHPFYGFQDGTHNPSKIEDVAALYLAEVKTIQPKGPYFLGGVCSGGTVAYEMAQQLKSQGEQVAVLALIEPAHPADSQLQGHFQFVRIMSRNIRKTLRQQIKKLLQMEKNETRAFAGMKFKLAANIWAVRHYIPKPYPGTLHLFLTGSTLKGPWRRRLDWQNLATAGSTLHEIPGDHKTITGTGETEIDETHMRDVARQLNICIRNALSNPK
jgi:amino acid adenylation domain-containing protein